MKILPHANQMDRIHSLWDELATFPVARGEDARQHLLVALCELLQGVNLCWIGAVRMGDAQPGDPVLGWRPRLVHYLHPATPIHTAGQEQTRQLEAGTVDITTIRNIEGCGRFRANRVVDLAGEPWFEGEYCQAYYLDLGFSDAIWGAAPVNRDAEIYFGLYRGLDQPRFTPEERDLLLYALRGLSWFHRQQMLNFGLTVARSPLTPMERTVLHALLAGGTEKDIATVRNISTSTAHEYVIRIYRKYNVNSRAALLALWLGNGVQD